MIDHEALLAALPSESTADLRIIAGRAQAIIAQRDAIERDEQRVASIVARHEQAISEMPARVWDGSVVGPGGLILWPDEDGREYKNISGGWLSHDPEQYPWGWEPQDVELSPETPMPWEEGLSVKVDHLVTHGGQTWRAKIEHTTHSGWAPSEAAHAVWELVQ